MANLEEIALVHDWDDYSHPRIIKFVGARGMAFLVFEEHRITEYPVIGKY